MKNIILYPYKFFVHYLPNHFINKIPMYWVRHTYYRLVMGIKIGKRSSIHMGVFINRTKIKIGSGTAINRNCYLDGRGGLTIGNNVSISPEVQLITASHDLKSMDFRYIEKNIAIEDYVWVGTRSIVLPGCRLGKGSVVAAGSVVTRDVEPFTIVGGVPCKLIGMRRQDLDYTCHWTPPFD